MTTPQRAPREWQVRAQAKWLAAQPRDFLVSATPGAGKTQFALTMAKQLLDQGAIEQIVIVVPTDALRIQWADAAAAPDLRLKLMPVGTVEDYYKDDYNGVVVTYAQLTRSGVGSEAVRSLTAQPTLAILDEIHHAGENRAWGDGLMYAAEHAVHRIALTGTPWRRNEYEPIPFCTYDSSNKIHVDYKYEYGEAVADGVCRRIEFYRYAGSAKWAVGSTEIEVQLGEDLARAHLAGAMDAILDPRNEWMPALLDQADRALDEVREQIPDAAGLVVADNVYLARAYLDYLARRTGTQPTLVVSDEVGAKENLDRFRDGTSKWIVAVRMVSEGVDIPRLAVGVYATRAATPLFFRQVVGRFVRVRLHDDVFNSRLYMPDTPDLMKFAREIEDELRHQLAFELELEQKQRDDDDHDPEPRQYEPRDVLSASPATWEGVVLSAEDLEPDEVSSAADWCRQHGIPVAYAANVALGHRRTLLAAPVPFAAETAEAPIVPQYKAERMLRSELDALVGAVARNRDQEKKDINIMIRTAGFPPRAQCSMAELERLKQYLLGLNGGA